MEQKTFELCDPNQFGGLLDVENMTEAEAVKRNNKLRKEGYNYRWVEQRAPDFFETGFDIFDNDNEYASDW